MSTTNGLSYSATLSRGLPAKKPLPNVATPPQNTNTSKQPTEGHVQREPSHAPRTEREEEHVYVLTLLTDQPLHTRMTGLRKKYFPKKINKLAAHLTLFHALPGTRLISDVIPTLSAVARRTAPFRVEATDPFRLKKGFAISVSSQNGGRQAKQVHAQLQQEWKKEGWLSDQDAGGCRVHYTLMNKVDDDTVVQEALAELKTYWKGDNGTAEVLALWRYDRGFWRWERKFSFDAKLGDRDDE